MADINEPRGAIGPKHTERTEADVIPKGIVTADLEQFIKLITHEHYPLRVDVKTEIAKADHSSPLGTSPEDDGRKHVITSMSYDIPRGAGKITYMECYKDQQGNPIYIDYLDKEALSKHMDSSVITALNHLERVREKYPGLVMLYSEDLYRDGINRSCDTQEKVHALKLQLAEKGARPYPHEVYALS